VPEKCLSLQELVPREENDNTTSKVPISHHFSASSSCVCCRVSCASCRQRNMCYIPCNFLYFPFYFWLTILFLTRPVSFI
jgi:hypothetical protein